MMKNVEYICEINMRNIMEYRIETESKANYCA